VAKKRVPEPTIDLEKNSKFAEPSAQLSNTEPCVGSPGLPDKSLPSPKSSRHPQHPAIRDAPPERYGGGYAFVGFKVADPPFPTIRQYSKPPKET
jgi:hypothetical protein